MNGKWILKLAIVFGLAALTLTAASAGAGPPGGGEEIVVTLYTPPFELATSGGLTQVNIPGYEQSGLPGKPLLPEKLVRVALPPDALLDSVALEVVPLGVTEPAGTYRIAPAPPAAARPDGRQVVDWGAAGPVAAGRDMAVYGSDAFYPATFARLGATAQMRQWRLAEVRLTPAQFNPATGQLQLATAVELRLSYRRAAASAAPVSDPASDEAAAALSFVNVGQAQAWYAAETAPAPAPSTVDLVIVTTNQIVAGSAQLNNYVAHKQAQGLGVAVITQNQYGGLNGQSPNGTAEKIRQWLINNYLTQGIRYVLLIGNPDPDDPEQPADSVGDVPMKMAWPRQSDSNYRETPTDQFYADLTGNWNVDGDSYFGEYNDDGGAGGVDFYPEVYVGRIPVYVSDYNWAGKLDAILQKIIAYETSTNTGWRKTVLLPMSFSDSQTDGAFLAERMKSDYLNGQGFNSFSMYQQSTSSYCNSVFAGNAPLTNRATRAHWQANAYGLVTWWAHGNAQVAALDCSEGILLDTLDPPFLNDSFPAFVYQASCSNGYPEASNNLGYELLKQGAIGTVSASRVSWYAIGQWQPYPGCGDNATIGYYYDQSLAANQPAGAALLNTKSQMGHCWGGTSWQNLMDFNLYGDPSVRLLPGAQNAPIRVSASGKGAVDGIPFQPADILTYDPAADTWKMTFDASDVGVKANLSAVEFLANGDILMAFQANQKFVGLFDFNWAPLGTVTIRPQDVVVFTPASLGDNTSGWFRWLVDGSDIGLTTAAERIDALGETPPGHLLISPAGKAIVPNAPPIQNEDLALLHVIQPGSNTVANWLPFLPGAVVPGMPPENLNGAWMDPQSGDLYLTLGNAFNVGGVQCDAHCIIIVRPGPQVIKFWDSRAHRFNKNLDAIDL